MWIGIDLDKTIFDENQKLINGARDAINALYDAGHRISICSARGYIALKHGIPLEEEKSHIENLLDKNGVNFSDVYFGVKPACDVWIDDKTITKEPQLTWKEIKNRIIPKPGLVLVMLTGFPGAGKSTLLKNRFGKNYVCLSRDALVGMFQTGNTDESKTIAKRLEVEGTKAAFENGKSVAIDKLNLTKKNRSLFIKLAKKYNAVVVCFYVNVSAKDAWEQNAQREPEKIVKKEKFNSMVKRFEPPSTDEGFDSIIELTKDNREDYEKMIPEILDVENSEGLIQALNKDKEITKKSKIASEILAIIKKCPESDKDDRPDAQQQYCLYTSDGDRLLGRHPSKEKAIDQEKAIQVHKHGSVIEKIINEIL